MPSLSGHSFNASLKAPLNAIAFNGKMKPGHNSYLCKPLNMKFYLTSFRINTSGNASKVSKCKLDKDYMPNR